ncbi:hypothetical protein PDR5_42980 [Pseudomonas sp. DR 5-09]|nr:hypothetical protein PDR5_42980 [Pseudomonas sp. DR 5-09]
MDHASHSSRYCHRPPAERLRANAAEQIQVFRLCATLCRSIERS